MGSSSGERADEGARLRQPEAAYAKAFVELVDVVGRLRDPERGCPWDRAQDHRTLRPYVIEEAYETAAAIDGGSPEALADELGDLLLQVLLHSRIASERSEFDIADVIERLRAKLVRRHPHVFSKQEAKSVSAIRETWHSIKRDEKGRRGGAEALPALIRARKRFDEKKQIPEESWEGALSEEEQLGAAILRSAAAACGRGYDPELALHRALSALERTGDGG